MKKKTIKIIVVILLVGIALYRLSKQRPKLHHKSEITMGTLVSIDIIDKNYSPEIMDSAFSIIHKKDSIFSISNPRSEVSRVNNHTKESIKISSSLKNLILASNTISEQTKGNFDITTGILIDEYDFAHESMPDAETIRNKLKHINFKNLNINGNKLEKSDSAVKINFGGIAKGYIIDRVRHYFSSMNIQHFVINAGGDIYLTDQRDGERWSIGIRHPRKKGELFGQIKLKNKAIVTSGDYEQYFFKDSLRIHHILNPYTGLPGKKSISVTVIANDTYLADGLATALFVMGPEAGLKLIKRYENLDAIFIFAKDKKLYYSTSNNIKDYNLKIIDKQATKK